MLKIVTSLNRCSYRFLQNSIYSTVVHTNDNITYKNQGSGRFAATQRLSFENQTEKQIQKNLLSMMEGILPQKSSKTKTTLLYVDDKKKIIKISGINVAECLKLLVAKEQFLENEPTACLICHQSASPIVYFPRLVSPTGEDACFIYFLKEEDLNEIKNILEKKVAGLESIGKLEFNARSIDNGRMDLTSWPKGVSFLNSIEYKREQTGMSMTLFYEHWMTEVARTLGFAKMCNRLKSNTLEDKNERLISLTESLFHQGLNQLQTLRKNLLDYIKPKDRVKLKTDVPQVAIIGEKGVGKSEFLNLLAQREISKVKEKNDKLEEEIPNMALLKILGHPALFIDNPSIMIASDKNNGRNSDLKILLLNGYNFDPIKPRFPAQLIKYVDNDTLIVLTHRDRMNHHPKAIVGPTDRYMKASPFFPKDRPHTRRSHRDRPRLKTLKARLSGTRTVFGDYCLQVLEPGIIRSIHLDNFRQLLRYKLRFSRGYAISTRVHAGVPFTLRPNDARMGKGKGSFGYWGARIPLYKVLFEISGNLRKQTAIDAFRFAARALPLKTHVIARDILDGFKDFCERLNRNISQEFSAKKQPAGIWCVSNKNGDGIQDFVKDLNFVLESRFYHEAIKDENGLPVHRYRHAFQKISTHLSSLRVENDLDTIIMTLEKMHTILQETKVDANIHLPIHLSNLVAHLKVKPTY